VENSLLFLFKADIISEIGGFMEKTLVVMAAGG